MAVPPAGLPPLPRRPVPVPIPLDQEKVHVWEIAEADFMRMFCWWVQWSDVEPWVRPTTYEGGQEGTYIAWWLGNARHSRNMWKMWFGTGCAYNPAKFENQEAADSWIKTVLRDRLSLMQTKHGLHMTIMYAGPMSHDQRKQVCCQMLAVKAEFLPLRNRVTWRARVEQMFHPRKHALADPGESFRDLAQEWCITDLTEDSTPDVVDYLRGGRIDLTRYAPSDTEGGSLTAAEREQAKCDNFLQWHQRAIAERALVEDNAKVVEEVNSTCESQSMFDQWTVFAYRIDSSTSIFGSELWELGVYTSKRLMPWMYCIDAETGLPVIKCKKGMRIIPHLSLHVTPVPEVEYAVSALEMTMGPSKYFTVTSSSWWAHDQQADKRPTKGTVKKIGRFRDSIDQPTQPMALMLSAMD